MEENNIKRKRTANFTADEEEILISFVKKYKHILENKKSDAVTNSEKMKIWEKIAKEYSSVMGCSKTSLCLRTKYNNMKKNVKKKFAEEKSYLRCTGGGPSIKVDISNTDNTIKEMLGDTVTGFVSKYDADSDKHNLANDIATEENIQEEFIIEYVDEAEPTVSSEGSCDNSTNESMKSTLMPETPTTSSNWSKYNAAKLKTPKSLELKLKNDDKNIQKKISTWALAKADLVELQKKSFLEEQQLKLQHMQEKHDLYMAIQREEWEIKKERLLSGQEKNV
uniref:Regulatory protein zeste n=1 Tax=Diabrotica virgifera virgifera TaxID=50390 RepID=A0A6P7GY29_DIAVI